MLSTIKSCHKQISSTRSSTRKEILCRYFCHTRATTKAKWVTACVLPSPIDYSLRFLDSSKMCTTCSTSASRHTWTDTLRPHQPKHGCLLPAHSLSTATSQRPPSQPSSVYSSRCMLRQLAGLWWLGMLYMHTFEQGDLGTQFIELQSIDNFDWRCDGEK